MGFIKLEESEYKLLLDILNKNARLYNSIEFEVLYKALFEKIQNQREFFDITNKSFIGCK